MSLLFRFAAHLTVLAGSLFLVPMVAPNNAHAAVPCTAGFIPGDGFRGIDGVVYGSTMWDPDGAGPRTPVLVMVGSFTYAGTVRTKNVVSYDPATDEWGVFANGIGNNSGSLIYAATVLSTGELVIAGGFDIANGAIANSVARWDTATSSWQQLGNGITGGFVTALAPLANGGLVAGGNFYTLNGGPAGHIARWDGTAWSNMNGGMTAPSSIQVFSLAALDNGDVIAGGLFATAGGVPAQNIARWSPAGGGSWSAFGAGASTPVTALAALPGNSFIVGGNFNSIAGNAISGLAKFSPAAGGTWSAYASSPTGGIATINPRPNGDLLLGGYFATSGAVSTPYIAQWTAASSSWSTFGGGTNNVVRSISVFSNGDFAACGDMTQINGLPGKAVQIWNGSMWLNWPGFGGPVRSIAHLPNGDTIAGGYIPVAGIGAVNNIARRTGSTWSPIGAGLDGPALALLALPDSSFIVGGEFNTAGPIPASRIARCSSAGVWSDLGDGLDSGVFALLRASNGDIIAGGDFTGNVARWDGSTWTTLGSGPGGSGGGSVYALAQLATGEIVAAGSFSVENGAAGNAIAIWDGTNWLPLAEGFNDEVNALSLLPDGNLVAGGYFTQSGEGSIKHLAVWNGSEWSELGGGTSSAVLALALLDNGQLIVGGDFSNAGPTFSLGIARWDGSNWLSMDLGVSGTVYALAAAQGNAVHLGGQFLGVGAGPFDGGLASPYFSDWSDGAFQITQQPSSASNCPTGTASFTFGVAGPAPTSYQWYFDNSPIDPGVNPTALDPILVLDHPTPDMAGSYYCEASGSCGMLTSDSATLFIESCCPADLNFDGLVDDTDFQIFVIAYNELLCPDFPNTCEGDLNLDGLVDDTDFQLFVPAYNALLCP